MDRDELWEWIGLLAAIVVWWPGLVGWFPAWYRLAVYAFCGVIIVWVGIRRIRRVREGLQYSQEITDYQRRHEPPEPLEGESKRQKG